MQEPRVFMAQATHHLKRKISRSWWWIPHIWAMLMRCGKQSLGITTVKGSSTQELIHIRKERLSCNNDKFRGKLKVHDIGGCVVTRQTTNDHNNNLSISDVNKVENEAALQFNMSKIKD